jgi:hypothetical protein
MKYWITVATTEHVNRGLAKSYLQIGHGKRAPLARLKANDWVIFYSPKVSLSDKTPVEAFTAIGQVTDDEITQAKVTPEFEPYRRKFDYHTSARTDIKPLVKELKFLPDKQNWQYILRHGLIGISKDDFNLIHQAILENAN